MYDFTKLRSYDQRHVQRLFLFAQSNFKTHKAPNRNYISFANASGRFRLEFRKSIFNGELLGYMYVEICFSPHYYFNNDLHNGNDFTPQQSISTLKVIMQYLNIKNDDVQDFQVVNLEFGVNTILDKNPTKIVEDCLYTQKKLFRFNNSENTSKIYDAVKSRIIKLYDKGFHFAAFPQYGININTFRFEVKSKKSEYIRKLGIKHLGDLLDIDKYKNVSAKILEEWNHILLINTGLNDVKNRASYWSNLLEIEKSDPKKRNLFTSTKKKYYSALKKSDIDLESKTNLHELIKLKISEKLKTYLNCAICPHKTTIKSTKLIIGEDSHLLIKGQTAHKAITNRICRVTDIDISRQKKGSIFLREETLKNIKENEPRTYLNLEKKYLTDKAKNLSEQKQMELICKNIRDSESNPRNNRKRFEIRNYHPNQLQLFEKDYQTIFK